MKILILKLSSFGDIIHCLPVLSNLKNNFPSAQIDWLVSESFSELLENHPQINKLYKLPKKPLEWPKVLQELKQTNFDIVLEMQGLIKTSLIAKYIKPKQIIGVIPFRERIAELFIDHKIQSNKIHIIEHLAAVLEHFGLRNPNLNDFGLAQINSNSKEKTIICAPESRWQSKNWQYWPEFIEELIKNFPEFKIVLLGSESDNPKNNHKQIIDLRGKTKLKDLPEIIAQAVLVIGSDSGLIHLASAYHKKTLGIYGPTNPARTGPWNGDYLWLNLECSPCHKRKCPLKGENNLKCLKEISLDLALKKVKEILC